MQLWRGTLGVQASGLVLGLLEAEDGTARHRTSQPGEISRPSSRQKHWDPLKPGIQTCVLPGTLAGFFSKQDLQAFSRQKHWDLFQAWNPGPLPGIFPDKQKTWNTFQGSFQAKLLNSQLSRCNVDLNHMCCPIGRYCLKQNIIRSSQ